MSNKRHRRVNDGWLTGLKQDRFRNSDFEYEERRESRVPSGNYRKTPNTLGGAWAENRGRRAADERFNDDNNPFEVGRVQNWNRRQGWDQYYDGAYDKEGNRSRGGALIGDDFDSGHRGRGPKGYTRSDERIYEDVCEQLSFSPHVDASDVEVKVEKGVVFLNGTVQDRNTKRMAELEIENISGVRDVQNLLSFKRDEGGPKERQLTRGPENLPRDVRH